MEEKEKGPVIIALTQEDLSNLLEKAVDVGARAGIDRYVEELKLWRKEKADKRLHNTKLLLRNYRMLEVHAEDSVFGRAQMGETAVDILESMMNLYNDELMVESIRNSATRTAIIVAHIRAMLDAYQIICEKSGDEIEIRRFNILYDTYIAADRLPDDEIASKYYIAKRTVRNDLKIATNRLSCLLFGIDGLGS